MDMKQPNILLITTDQQRFDTIAALGGTHLYTPHLDWLVDEGIAFTRAYSDCPICMPARATIMTGLHAHSHGLTGNNDSVLPLKCHPTLPGLLTAAGYQTRAQGKMHFEPMRANYGFEHMELPMDYYRERRRLGGAQPKQHGVGENEITPVISTVHETESLTHWTVQRSIDFIETRDETRPFFLWTSFTKPHPPFDPCANYWALYANKNVPLPVHGDWSQSAADVPQGFMRPTYMLNNAWRADESQLLDAKRAYCACITQIDFQLGLLFARMRELDLLENTWIIFTSDHGDMQGDHCMGAKTVFFEGSAHIPLIIRPPAGSFERTPLAGRRVDDPVNLTDIMPTLLALAGIESPEPVDGISLLDVIDGTVEKRELIGESENFWMVLSGQYKYTWAGDGGGELMFDLSTDPCEKHDLVRAGSHGELLDQMRAKLAAHLEKRNSDYVENGHLKPGPAIAGPDAVAKWPGFHSTVCPSDVLH